MDLEELHEGGGDWDGDLPDAENEAPAQPGGDDESDEGEPPGMVSSSDEEPGEEERIQGPDNENAKALLQCSQP